MDSALTERRRQTRSNIYRCLYETSGFCTRQTLALALGYSLPTIYQNLSELVDMGLVRYSGEAQSTGGRRAAGLEIIPDARMAVGISVTADGLRIAAADLKLHELAQSSVKMDFFGRSLQYIGRAAAEQLELFLDRAGLDRSRLLGVCIALPGIFTPDRSRVLFAPTLQLSGEPLDDLYKSIPYPCCAANDATRSGHAEWFARGAKVDMAYLSLESGIGGSVFIGGAPYLGSNHRSCEFGHMCIVPGGLPCSCGKQGCLESYCSLDRISRKLGLTPAQFFDALERHNPEYGLLWSDVLQHLAIGIANIRMAFDCDIVLGGQLSQYLPPYMNLLREIVAANDPFGGNASFLSLSVLGGRSVPLGAALYYINEFLDSI